MRIVKSYDLVGTIEIGIAVKYAIRKPFCQKGNTLMGCVETKDLGHETIQSQTQKVSYYVEITFAVNYNGVFLGIFKKRFSSDATSP